MSSLYNYIYDLTIFSNQHALSLAVTQKYLMSSLHIDMFNLVIFSEQLASSSPENFMQVKFKGKVSRLPQVLQLSFEESK